MEVLSGTPSNLYLNGEIGSAVATEQLDGIAPSLVPA